MANDGPDTNGSQWCFMLRASPHLDYLHSEFGQLAGGLEILPRIQQGDDMKVKTLRGGKDAGAFQVTKESFAGMVAEARRYQGQQEPGPAAPFDDPDKLLPVDWPRAKAVNNKLANLERFTGRRAAARVLGKPPAGEDGINRYPAETATRLKPGPAGLLAVYCVDGNQWYFRWGPDVPGIPLDQQSATQARLISQANQLRE